MTIDDLKQKVAEPCRDYNVKRLYAFGSVARGTPTGASDVDLLVEFQCPSSQPANQFFGLLHRLEDILGCEVDLLTPGGLRNPYFKKRVLQERVPLYEC